MDIPKELVNHIAAGNAVLFIGAGLSMAWPPACPADASCWPPWPTRSAWPRISSTNGYPDDWPLRLRLNDQTTQLTN